MSAEEQFRQKFLSVHKDNIEKGTYEGSDIEKVKNDDNFLNAYLKHNKLDVEKATSFLHGSLEWRKVFQVKELNASAFPISMHESNTIFFYNTDKTGHKILHVQVVKMKKDVAYTDMAKRFLVWQIEQEFQLNVGKQIVILLDMSGAGLSNVDVNFIKFLISCFSANYPYMLEYILIVDMPWILNAVWQLIKKWLSTEQQKFALVIKQNELPKYINKESLFIHLGGMQKMPNIAVTQDVFDDIKSANEDIVENHVTSNTTTTYKRNTTSLTNSTKKESLHASMSESNIPSSNTNVTISKSNNDIKSSVKSVIIRPEEYLIYDQKSESEDTSAVITIQNKTVTRVAFKVKTTNPDSYKVRPISGIVNATSNAKITVTLLAGKQLNTIKDRFQLVLLMIRDETMADDLSSLWKNIPSNPDDYADHRFSCKLFEDSKDQTPKTLMSMNQYNQKVSNEEIMIKLNSIQQFQYIIIFVTFLILIKLIMM